MKSLKNINIDHIRFALKFLTCPVSSVCRVLWIGENKIKAAEPGSSLYSVKGSTGFRGFFVRDVYADKKKYFTDIYLRILSFKTTTYIHVSRSANDDKWGPR